MKGTIFMTYESMKDYIESGYSTSLKNSLIDSLESLKNYPIKESKKWPARYKLFSDYTVYELRKYPGKYSRSSDFYTIFNNRRR